MLKDRREIIREEMSIRDKIAEILKEGPMTVPEVAAKLKASTYEVMYWMMAMRKYGWIVETEEVTEDSYYKYKLVERRK